MRLVWAFATASVLAVVGGLALESLGAPTIAYYALVVAGVLLATAIDREHFYGSRGNRASKP